MEHPFIDSFFQLLAMGLEGAAVPNFKTAESAHQNDFPAEPGVVPEIVRHQDAALAIQGALLGAGNE